MVLSHTIISFGPIVHKGLIDQKHRTLLRRGQELGIQEILNWFSKNEHHTFLKLYSDRITKIESVMRILEKLEKCLRAVRGLWRLRMQIRANE